MQLPVNKSGMDLLNLMLVVAITATPCKAFLFDVQTDCLLSTWSVWTYIPGLAAPIRERSILRHDHRGGRPCPPKHDLRQINVTKPLTTTMSYFQDYHQQEIQQLKVVNDTAHSIAHNFLRRTQPEVGGQQELHFRDLLIILDSSGSIGGPNYARTKRSLSGLLKRLCPDPEPFGPFRHHAAMIVYSDTVEVQFNFTTYTGTRNIENAIDRAPFLDGETCTTNAFDKAFDMISTQYGMRSSNEIEKEVLILTDGQSNCGGDVLAAAERLQEKARVFALLIGEATGKGIQETAQYVSSPVPKHLFALGDIREFDKLIQVINDPASGLEDCVPFNPSTD